LTSLAETLEEPRTNPGRLASLVNASPVAMYTCKPEGDFATTFVTEGVRTLWGYEPEDFLRDPCFWSSRLHPEDAPRVLEQFSRVVAGTGHGYDYRFRTMSGRYRWMHDEVRLVRDAAGRPLEIAGYCFDITEQKLAEAALRESEARQKVIFNSTSDLQTVFRVEPGNAFVTEAVNRAMAENLRTRMGRDANHFIGKDFAELLSATGLGVEEIEIRRLLYRQVAEQRTTVRFDTPPSELRDALEVSVSPVMDQQGNCTHLLWNGRNISKRIQAEAKRRESEERYALVTEAIHEGIFDWDLVTGTYYLSPRYKEILGYRDEELPNDIEAFFGRIHPDDRARMTQTVARYHHDRTKDRFLDELRLEHRDGTYRWVVSRGRIVRNDRGDPIRFVGAIGDMTERMESAAKLAANEKRLRDILNSLLGFVGLFTPDGVLIDCNDTAIEDAGLKSEDVLGKLFWETPGWRYEPEEQIRVREMMMRAAEGEIVRFETRVRDLGQQPMIVDFTFRPLRDPSGSVRHVIGHGVDITARQQAEAELIHAKEAAESSNRAKSEFLANMSHEIRTPMNGIIGLTEVLLDSSLDPEQLEYLTLVKKSAESLLVIINDILDVSKIEAGKLRLEAREFDLREVTLGIVKSFRVQADAKDLSLSCDFASGVPALVRGDPERLRQILINLIGNAIKFTDHGRIAVAIDCWPEGADALHFAVTDTGIGIPAEKQAMIFEAFTQVDGSFTRRFGGTGLGLTIAHRLVRMMDGQIWVESQEGQGSTFHFTARLKPASGEASGAGNSKLAIGPVGL
jgi:two-component system, sensor histidine kinase and response regulator